MSACERTALVIDDDPDILELLQVLLEAIGFRVDAARDGIDVVKLRCRYDVILLDLKMPIFDGERLTDYWLLTQPDILKRVIILSGYDHFTEGRRLPTFATVQKPFDHATLVRVVERCATQSKAPDPA